MENKTKCREIIIILPLFGKLKKTSALGLFSWRPLSKKSPFDFLVPSLLSSAWSGGGVVVRQVVGKEYAFTMKKDYYVKNTEKTQRPSWEHLCAQRGVWRRWGQHVDQRQPLKSLCAVLCWGVPKLSWRWWGQWRMEAGRGHDEICGWKFQCGPYGGWWGGGWQNRRQ